MSDLRPSHEASTVDGLRDASAGSGPRVLLGAAGDAGALRAALGTARAAAVGALIAIVVPRPETEDGAPAWRGRTAAEVADLVIVTGRGAPDDDADAARAAILAGVRAAHPRVLPVEIRGPVQAIRLAVQLAGEVGSVYWDASDRPGSVAEATSALAELGW